MPAKHHQAYRQRRRQDEADRPPQRRPERGRNDDRDRGEAGAVPVDHRLDDMSDDRLDDEKQRGRPDQHRPAGVDGGRQGQGEQRRDDGADIGHEAKDGREDAPEHRARDANEPQARSDHDAKGRIQGELHEEEATETACRVVERRGRLLQILRAGKLDEPIPEILALQENEDDENDRDAGGRERLQQRRNQRGDAFQRTRRRLTHLDRDRSRLLPGRGRLRRCPARRGVLGLVELLAEILQHVGGAFERAAGRRRATQRLDLFAHGGLVARQIAGQLIELCRDHPPDAGNEQEGKKNHADHRHGARVCHCCSRRTTGASTKLSRIASAIGTKISRPK